MKLKYEYIPELKTLTLYGLDTLLEYAKYLEDNGQLSYDLLKQRVDTYRKSEVADE